MNINVYRVNTFAHCAVLQIVLGLRSSTHIYVIGIHTYIHISVCVPVCGELCLRVCYLCKHIHTSIHLHYGDDVGIDTDNINI